MEDASVVFQDRTVPGQERLLRKELAGGAAVEVLADTGFLAGPAAGGGYLAWQNSSSEACERPFAAGEDHCLAVSPAQMLAVSGGKAVISEKGNSTIRLIDFEVGRSRMLDSYATPGMRYDPDIDGNNVVWVKERGYAGKYHEPVIVAYDLGTDTSSYLTGLGGGQSSTGGSKYQRRHPDISNGRVVYQQKLNESGEQWDIYLADPPGFGTPLVEAPGDQVNPSLDGNLVVYQDNRNGHVDGTGAWVEEWDIYVKDLASGVEQPVCTVPGDQINPVIKGNTVVWEDNRGGDWDIYAATIKADPSAEPRLILTLDSVFWGSYADYLDGLLSVRYGIGNAGSGAALEAEIGRVTVSPSEVTVDSLPQPAALIGPGQTAGMEVRYRVPRQVRFFRTSLFGHCHDEAGTELWFPFAPPGD